MRGERNAILQQLFGAMGGNAWVESPFNCDYGYNITVGENFYANSHCTILDCAPVTIGGPSSKPVVEAEPPAHCATFS